MELPPIDHPRRQHSSAIRACLALLIGLLTEYRIGVCSASEMASMCPHTLHQRVYHASVRGAACFTDGSLSLGSVPAHGCSITRLAESISRRLCRLRHGWPTSRCPTDGDNALNRQTCSESLINHVGPSTVQPWMQRCPRAQWHALATTPKDYVETSDGTLARCPAVRYDGVLRLFIIVSSECINLSSNYRASSTFFVIYLSSCATRLPFDLFISLPLTLHCNHC